MMAKNNAFAHILKILFLIQAVWLLLAFPAYSQCKVSILAGNADVDSIYICSGQAVYLSATGENVLILEEFNLSGLGPYWSYCSANVTFQAPCDPINPNPYLWFGALCPADRILETHNLDLALGGILEFDLKFALQNGPVGCEGPDEMLEGVSLQYSVDSGNTWTDITYFCPNGSFLPSNPWVQSPLTMFPTQFTSWGTYTYVIPPLAMTSHTRLRWIQESTSFFNGHHDDNWGLDNIRISRSILQEIHWGDGTTSPSLPTLFPTQTTTYHVYVINILNPADTLGQDSITVVVLPSPASEVSGDTVICHGDSTYLEASGPYTFAWNTGATGAGLMVMPAGTTVYTVTATNDFGCEAIRQTEVKVLPLPEAVVHGDSVCPGETAALLAEGGVSYLWSNGITTAEQQFIPVASAVFYVTVTDQNGCQDKDSVVVKVLSPPQATISPDMVICYGDKVQLVAGGGAFYHWSTGSVKQDIFVEPLSETVYQVTVTDAYNCSDVASMTVYVNPFHEVELITSRDTICRGSSAVLSASGGSRYEWNTGRIDPEITVSPDYPTDYYVKVSDEFMNTWCEVVRYIEIQVKECENFYFPNAISPKGYNPVFKPIGEYQQLKKYSLMIYDRWGKMVFMTNNPDEGWNGTMNGDYVPGGTYVYYIHFNKTIDGFPYDRAGTVTVVY